MIQNNLNEAPWVLGIDPGKKGALVFLDITTRKIIAMIPMPLVKNDISGKRLVHAITQYSQHLRHAYMEAVHAMPGQGVCSMFSFGHGFGLLHGILYGMEIDFTLVSPIKWQKVLFEKRGDTKEQAKAFVKSRFPGTSFLANDRCRVDHDGVIDALCLAWYGAEMEKNMGRRHGSTY